MGRHERLLQTILHGRSAANASAKPSTSTSAGSTFIRDFRSTQFREEPQVKQVRRLILKYRLEEEI